MRRLVTLTASCAFLALSGIAAQADCAEDLASFTGDSGGGISKDGSLAPLQSEGSAEQATSSSEVLDGKDSGDAAASADGKIAKDGSQAPLEGEGTGAGTAMSGQDAQAQQEGGDAMAGSAERDALIEDAREALAAGDEEACQNALEEARNL